MPYFFVCMTQGFWREHLRGKPYHIRQLTARFHTRARIDVSRITSGLTCGILSCSALYVVDLVKFRETAAGDNLRVFYETLSKDPNSLANLDQVSDHLDDKTHLRISVSPSIVYTFFQRSIMISKGKNSTSIIFLPYALLIKVKIRMGMNFLDLRNLYHFVFLKKMAMAPLY